MDASGLAEAVVASLFHWRERCPMDQVGSGEAENEPCPAWLFEGSGLI
jgi:hypothetical protein